MFSNLKRLFTWLPIIWRDRDFDYAYMWQLFAYKVKRMHDCMKDDPFTNNELEIKQMKTCYLLMQRLSDDEFNDQAIDKWHRERERLLDKDKKEGYNCGNEHCTMCTPPNPKAKLRGWRFNHIFRPKDEKYIERIWKLARIGQSNQRELTKLLVFKMLMRANRWWT